MLCNDKRYVGEEIGEGKILFLQNPVRELVISATKRRKTSIAQLSTTP
jgi:hypothetical protein